jgi:hypothetical protein
MDSEEEVSYSEDTEEADEIEACLFEGKGRAGTGTVAEGVANKGSTVKFTGNDNNSVKGSLPVDKAPGLPLWIIFL